MLAPAGTRLPITARFKANARPLRIPAVAGVEAMSRAIGSTKARASDLRLFERGILGRLDDYDTVDLSAGVTNGRWSVELFVEKLMDVNGAPGKPSSAPRASAATPTESPRSGPRSTPTSSGPDDRGRLGTKF